MQKMKKKRGVGNVDKNAIVFIGIIAQGAIRSVQFEKLYSKYQIVNY